jgi:hypothetical protein
MSKKKKRVNMFDELFCTFSQVTDMRKDPLSINTTCRLPKQKMVIKVSKLYLRILIVIILFKYTTKTLHRKIEPKSSIGFVGRHRCRLFTYYISCVMRMCVLAEFCACAYIYIYAYNIVV